jgi:hypothetical protein
MIPFVAIQFFTHVLINFQKNPKIAKNNEKSKKIRKIKFTKKERS